MLGIGTARLADWLPNEITILMAIGVDSSVDGCRATALLVRGIRSVCWDGGV